MENNLYKNKRHCTSVLTDIRNFSKTFKDFQHKESDEFLRFIENYYMLQNTLARTISEKVHMSSTGDGILAIFLDKNDHHKKSYAYILSTHRLLNKICKEFAEKNPSSNISFGMGADSGSVWKVGDGFLRTYVGTVINRASRIEESTKLFANVTTAVGNSLYKSLVKDFYPVVHEVLDETEDYDSILNKNPEAILISKKFALQYIFNMPLKGIQGDAPIFRVSESLINEEKFYWNLMEKLIGEEKSNKIKELYNV